MHPPGSQEALDLDVVWPQLTDDMFVSGFPSVDGTCSATKLRAYQAFGVLLGSLVVNKGSLPLQIDDDVLKFAFGLRKDCAEDIRQQMDAIRTGVFKVEMARPELKRIARQPAFCGLVKLGPPKRINTGENKDEFVDFLLQNVTILRFLRAKMKENWARHRCAGVQVTVVDEMKIQYIKESNTVVLPSVNAWIAAFNR
jgi:hypothetical protein